MSIAKDTAAPIVHGDVKFGLLTVRDFGTLQRIAEDGRDRIMSADEVAQWGTTFEGAAHVVLLSGEKHNPVYTMQQVDEINPREIIGLAGRIIAESCPTADADAESDAEGNVDTTTTDG